MVLFLLSMDLQNIKSFDYCSREGSCPPYTSLLCVWGGVVVYVEQLKGAVSSFHLGVPENQMHSLRLDSKHLRLLN